jgi:hypothetical protein
MSTNPLIRYSCTASMDEERHAKRRRFADESIAEEMDDIPIPEMISPSVFSKAAKEGRKICRAMRTIGSNVMGMIPVMIKVEQTEMKSDSSDNDECFKTAMTAEDTILLAKQVTAKTRAEMIREKQKRAMIRAQTQSLKAELELEKEKKKTASVMEGLKAALKMLQYK